MAGCATVFGLHVLNRSSNLSADYSKKHGFEPLRARRHLKVPANLLRPWVKCAGLRGGFGAE